jgi:hypothetical protein
MSKIILQSSNTGTGDITIASPNSNTDRTLTLPDNSGTVLTSATTTGFPAGTVLQVVTTFKDTVFSAALSGVSFTDVTGFSATITPRATTSRILVLANFGLSTTGIAAGARLLRDATSISNGSVSGSRTSAATPAVSNAGDGNRGVPTSINFVDSPSTTSAVTYKLQIGSLEPSGTHTVYFGTSGADSDFTYIARMGNSITLLEIAG